jgi:predicted transcriptional regulator
MEIGVEFLIAIMGAFIAVATFLGGLTNSAHSKGVKEAETQADVRHIKETIDGLHALVAQTNATCQTNEKRVSQNERTLQMHESNVASTQNKVIEHEAAIASLQRAVLDLETRVKMLVDKTLVHPGAVSALNVMDHRPYDTERSIKQ